MSSRIAVVPGSFDPPTLGHLDVIRRAASLYDELHVLVVHNPGKEAMLPIAQRLALLEQSIAESDIDGNVIVASWSMGLLVDYATDVGAGVLVKGIRSQIDVAYETPMAIVNRHLAHVETVFLLPDPAHALVSSSLVRQVAGLGGDVSPFVPPAVARFLDTGAWLSRRPARSARTGSMDPREKPQARTLQHQRARHRAPPRRDARVIARRARRRAVGRGSRVGRRGRADRHRCAPGVRARGDPRLGKRRHRVHRRLRTLPRRHRRGPSKSSFRSFSRILETKQLTSRFKTTTWILKLWSGMRPSWRFRFSRCVEPDCPGLDPATGERRAESTGAEQSMPPDPRWAALQEYTPDHDERSPARVAQPESPRTQKRASHGR